MQLRNPKRLPLALIAAWALFWILGLTGCGGSGEAPLPDEASATVGASATELRVPELALTVPAQAVSAGVTLTLRREAAGTGEIARYTLAPAGQPLRQPTTLRFERAGLPAGAAFFWVVDGETWLLPATRAGNVLSASLSSLGYAASGAAPLAQGARGRSRALAVRPLASPLPGDASLIVQQLDCQAHLAQLARRLKNTDLVNDMTRAVGIADDIVATEAACTAIDVQVLEQNSCDGLQRAVSQAQALLARDFGEFQSLTAPLYAGLAFVQLTGATCTGLDAEGVDALVGAKFEQFLSILQSQQRRGDFATEAGARELKVLFSYHALCQRLGLSSSCTRLTDAIFPNLLDGMRRTAFDQCRSNGAGLAVSQFHALGAEVDNAERFLDFARFAGSAVEADLVFCTDPALDLRVFGTDNGFPEEIIDRAKTLRPLRGLGSYSTGTDIEVPRNGSLTVGGRVPALQCADGSFSAAELVARIGGREVARRGVSGGQYTVSTPRRSPDSPSRSSAKAGSASKQMDRSSTTRSRCSRSASVCPTPSPRSLHCRASSRSASNPTA